MARNCAPLHAFPGDRAHRSYGLPRFPWNCSKQPHRHSGGRHPHRQGEGDDARRRKPAQTTPAGAADQKSRRRCHQQHGGSYPASTIVGVDLHQTQVLDADLLQLKAFPNLRTLNLFGTHITDAGLENLSTIYNLQSLRLANTTVTDAGLLSLQKACRFARNSPGFPTRKSRIRVAPRLPACAT